MTPSDFIEKIRPGADLCEATKGIPSGFTVAQAALESGWGKSFLAVKSNNLFGIKADKSWTGPTHEMMTTEYIKGQAVRVSAKWRSYDSWAACLLDHADFFHVNPRYSEALKYPHDPFRFAEEISRAGYATDPRYADKIIGVIKKYL